MVAHGGTQMAALEAFGKPERSYYDWITRPGGGFLLDASHWHRDRCLMLLREMEFSAPGAENSPLLHGDNAQSNRENRFPPDPGEDAP